MATLDHVVPQTKNNLQDALDASEARFHSLVQNSPDGIVVADIEGLIRFVNPEAEVMFGRTQDRLIGKSFGYPIVTGKSTEIEVLGSDRKSIVVEMRVAEIEWDGQPAFMCSLRDLTWRIVLMNDLKRSNADLDNFAAVVSQDIRAPLQNIGLLAKWFKEENDTELNLDAMDDIQLIISEANRMQKMLEDLLSYSQVSSYQNMSNKVNLQQVLCDSLENLSSEIFRSGAEIRQGELPVLECSAIQMVSVFEHLLSNAIYHCSDTPVISVDSKKSGSNWVIIFSDNANGIDEKNIEKIFLPFNPSQVTKGRNSAGIGLATCKKIIERHGGKIWLESKVGKGSTFYIQLPAYTAHHI